MQELLSECVPKTERDWRLLWARLGYWSWQVGSKVIMGVIYLSIIAEGFRTLIPVLGKKLYRLPLLGWMENYDGTYELDMASLLALFMLIAVCNLWSRVLTLWLTEQIGFDHRLWKQNNQDLFVLFFGFIVLLSDSVLFYVAITELSWSGATFSFTALFATTAYVSILVFSIYVAINLKEKIEILERIPSNEQSF